ncbi:fasciclin domain-containing protein [Pseudoalteromonas sp. MMG005]|uniref:fasciclin domain-containing protein n=1 Tax=Pseudoalteromonas sp. MMG005 TaxID=2822682 RepID=UPI0032B4C5C5
MTSLNSTLANPEKKFTVFALTDTAFAALGQDPIAAVLADTDKLSSILTYHVVSGEVDAAAAMNLTGTLVETVSNITNQGIYASNGVIHFIDTVITDTQ